MNPSRPSKGPTGYASARRSSSAPTVWRAASTRVFEILSNAIDEAREGYGDTIIVTQLRRPTPSRWRISAAAARWTGTRRSSATTGSWSSASCTPAANTTTTTGGDYEYSLGLNGLGACATQYASEYFDATIRRDGFKYTLHFEKGEIVGGLNKEPADRKKTGSDLPLEAGSRRLYRHRTSRMEYFRGHAQAAGRRQRRASPFRFARTETAASLRRRNTATKTASRTM